MKLKVNKFVTFIIIILAVAILACTAFLLIGDTCNNQSISQEYKNETTQAETENVTTENGEELDLTLPENPIDFEKLHNTNDEIIAWIQIPDTNVDYPILQSLEDDNYYLHRNLQGEYEYAGSIFIQYCNNSNMTDRVTVAYGHNMRDGSMFANLHKFSDKEFFDEHEEFYVYTEDRKLTYQVVSAYVYDDRHIMNSFNFAEDEVFEEYLDYIQNPRSITKNVRTNLDHELTTDDRILTLSTCLNSGDGRYLLQGVLIKDEHTR